MNTIKGKRKLSAKKIHSGAGSITINVNGNQGVLRAVVFSRSQAEILKSAADNPVIYFSRD